VPERCRLTRHPPTRLLWRCASSTALVHSSPRCRISLLPPGGMQTTVGVVLPAGSMLAPNGRDFLVPTGNGSIAPTGPAVTASAVPGWFLSSPTWTQNGVAGYVSSPARVSTNVTSALDNNPNTRAVFTGTAPVWFAVDIGACILVSRECHRAGALYLQAPRAPRARTRTPRARTHTPPRTPRARSAAVPVVAAHVRVVRTAT
jgi:hypothetical protein